MTNDDNDIACAGGCAPGGSKWDQATAAVTQVLLNTDDSVNWGLKFFPDNNACDASMAPAVPVGPMNSTAIVSAMNMTAPRGNTPTRDAILTGTAYLAALPDTNPKFLVLATDGLPNCPAGCASMTQPSNTCTQTDNPSEDAAVVMAIDAAFQQGIKTFVIGIGTLPAAENLLNAAALAGGEPQAGTATAYYAATDEQAMAAALAEIAGKVGSCPATAADAGP